MTSPRLNGQPPVRGLSTRPSMRPAIPRIQQRLLRLGHEISELLDSEEGHKILITQIVTDRLQRAAPKQVAYLDMRKVNNGTLGLELSQARTVQVHETDCSKTCLRITKVLMQADGTASPAMAAGLKKGDIITRCGQENTTSIEDLLKSVRRAQENNMKLLVLEYCRLKGFCFLNRDLEDARAQIEERCYRTGLANMLEEHVDSHDLQHLSPAELYALFPNPFARNAGSLQVNRGNLTWSGRVTQTLLVASHENYIQFGPNDSYAHQQHSQAQQKNHASPKHAQEIRSIQRGKSFGQI